MDDVKLALRGDKEAAKRMTEQGVLLPCPWCGAKVKRKSSLSGVNGMKWVYCTQCGAFGRPMRSTEEARLAWNTRAAVEMEVVEN